MKKIILMLCLTFGVHSHAVANGTLETLIIELENLKGLVAQQEAKQQQEGSDGSRWVFRYDILQGRIDEIIADIDRHIAVVNQTPRLERFKR